MAAKTALGIETALEAGGGSFVEKYRLMKDRLLNVEYEHWAAGFAEGNNHGRGHISRVLEYLDHLVGPKPLKHLDRYELFLAMMSILYHDLGLIRQRKGHEAISKALLEGDKHDAYIINPIDKEIIAAAVVSHSSSRDIGQECARFSTEEIIGNHTARPKVIAALVRLADELDEDHRRADPILRERLNLPPESTFFWLFCERVRGIRPNFTAKRIDLNLAPEQDDTKRCGPVPGGKTRHFVAFCAEKLAKMNQERVKVNSYLPPELQYSGLHVDVKPLPSHPKWKQPRTFVFNDSTTSQMFVQSFPELLDGPTKKTMTEILELLKHLRFDEAEKELDALASVLADLPIETQMDVLHKKACLYSMRSATFPENSPDQEQSLDQAVACLVQWFEQGQSGGFEATGRTASAEVNVKARDPDLALVWSKRQASLRKSIPSSYWPSRGGGGGCVPRGVLVEAPDGPIAVECLRVGMTIFSSTLQSPPQRIPTKVVRVYRSQEAICIRINGTFLFTPSQPLYIAGRWVRTAELIPGTQIETADSRPCVVAAVERVENNWEVYTLTTDHPTHNFLVSGLVCGNLLRK